MSAPPEPLLELRDLTVSIDARRLLDGVSLTLRGGELVVLVGPNGAGKTTLLRSIAGLQPAQGGIVLRGRALASLPLRERARSLAYLPQGHVFHWPLTVAAAVALGRLPHADPFTSRSAGDEAAVAAALQAVGIADLASRSVTELSGGERARVALARALATGAPLLLADEPTASLDPHHQLAVMDRLRASARSGVGVLAVTHDLALAARYGDRVLVMQSGRLVADGTAAEALTVERLRAVFAVEAVVLDIAGDSIPFARRPVSPPS